MNKGIHISYQRYQLSFIFASPLEKLAYFLEKGIKVFFTDS
ncbi:hypothetical protein BGS_0926 [Beggiatoa sp. SS]|nr:hypothetical protein BGS_0926 [Beggiatoa sp. SS]